MVFCQIVAFKKATIPTFYIKVKYLGDKESFKIKVLSGILANLYFFAKFNIILLIFCLDSIN